MIMVVVGHGGDAVIIVTIMVMMVMIEWMDGGKRMP